MHVFLRYLIAIIKICRYFMMENAYNKDERFYNVSRLPSFSKSLPVAMKRRVMASRSAGSMQDLRWVLWRWMRGVTIPENNKKHLVIYMTVIRTLHAHMHLVILGSLHGIKRELC